MADARKASGSVAFPVTRLLSSPAIVVAYSSEFVRDFSDESSPRRKRYALILKSVSREARGELETYFSAVLEDILSVRQVSVVCLHFADPSHECLALSGFQRARFCEFCNG